MENAIFLPPLYTSPTPIKHYKGVAEAEGEDGGMNYRLQFDKHQLTSKSFRPMTWGKL